MQIKKILPEKQTFSFCTERTKAVNLKEIYAFKDDLCSDLNIEQFSGFYKNRTQYFNTKNTLLFCLPIFALERFGVATDIPLVVLCMRWKS